jgi:hypothetical protein
MKKSKDPGIENSGVGGEPYSGGEPTKMPPDLKPDGPVPERNGQPMSSNEMGSATPSLVSAPAKHGAQPKQSGVGGFPGVGGGIGLGGSGIRNPGVAETPG